MEAPDKRPDVYEVLTREQWHEAIALWLISKGRMPSEPRVWAGAQAVYDAQEETLALKLWREL